MEGAKPLPTIMRNLNKQVRVFLKSDLCYEGTMVECDNYMNLVIDHAVEYMGDSKTAGYQRVLIRGNNVLYLVLLGK
ncbi:MAG: LSM domain-containing protein [Nitrososphaerota archaeon]